jgi:hypothetical protein
MVKVEKNEENARMKAIECKKRGKFEQRPKNSTETQETRKRPKNSTENA